MDYSILRMPKAVAEGVWIPLGKTEVEFFVQLPSSFNEIYQTEIFSQLQRLPDEGHGAVQMHLAQKGAFLEVCVLDAKGLPEGSTPRGFMEEFPIAEQWIRREAHRMARDSDIAVQEALGNSPASLDGALNGAGAKTNTPRSKPQEPSAPKAAAPN